MSEGLRDDPIQDESLKPWVHIFCENRTAFQRCLEQIQGDLLATTYETLLYHGHLQTRLALALQFLSDNIPPHTQANRQLYLLGVKCFGGAQMSLIAKAVNAQYIQNSNQ